MEWCKNLRSCEGLAMDKVVNFLLQEGDFDYEFWDVFFHGPKVPDWFDYQGSGPSLSFQMPNLQTCKLTGVTICVAYEPNNSLVTVSPPPVYKVTLTNSGRKVELIHQIGKGRDGGKAPDAVPGKAWPAYCWK